MLGPDDPSPLHTRSDSQSLPDTWEPACNQVSGSKYFMFHCIISYISLYIKFLPANYDSTWSLRYGTINVPLRLVTRITALHITPFKSNHNIWRSLLPVCGMAKVISTWPYSMLQNLISRGKEDSWLVLYVIRFSQAQFWTGCDCLPGSWACGEVGL